MQFEIDRDALLKPLQSVIGVVERRQTLPVLANLLMDGNDDGLSLTATDLEVELRAQVTVPVSEPGRVTVPARKLMDIVRNLPDDARIHVGADGERVVLRSGQSRFSLATLPAGDFPVVEGIGDAQTLELPQSRLRWLVDKTHFCMALQDVRYYLNGLLLELEPERFRSVATDGHRLALAEIPSDGSLSEGKQVIVPRKGIQELLRLLDDSDAPVAIELGGNHLRANLEGIQFTSKLIDGRFPDYQRVIPSEDGGCLICEREALRKALVRVSILSNEKYRGVRFAAEPERLRIQSNNPEQEEAEEELAVDYVGEPVEIGFNASYMLDALGAIEQSRVRLYLTDANSSALVLGEEAGDSRYVVMPMRL